MLVAKIKDDRKAKFPINGSKMFAVVAEHPDFCRLRDYDGMELTLLNVDIDRFEWSATDWTAYCNIYKK